MKKIEKKLADVYANIDWILERMDDLSERINDYIFESGVDIGLKKPNMKQLRRFDDECNELKARYDAELKILKKLLDY